MSVSDLGGITVIGNSIHASGGRRAYPNSAPGPKPAKPASPVATARAAALLVALAHRRNVWKSLADIRNVLFELRTSESRLPAIAGRTLHELIATFVRHGLVESMTTRPRLYVLRQQPRDQGYARRVVEAAEAFGFATLIRPPLTSTWVRPEGIGRG